MRRFAMLIPARSIGLRAARILLPGVAGRVLASFERACDLVTDAGEVVALVWGGVGNGPLNIVLAHGPGVTLPPGTRFTVSGTGDIVRSEPVSVDPVSPAVSRQTKIRGSRSGLEASAGLVVCRKQPAEASSPGDYLRISPIVIDLSSAVPWNPQPDWQLLRARRPQIAAGAATIAGILAQTGWSPALCGLPEIVCAQATRGQPSAICDLVGRGPGLTPAGDDWLAGWLLARGLVSNLTGSRSRSISGLILKTAAEGTTTLSRALLACAAAGEADEAWHALLTALVTDPMPGLVHDGLSIPSAVTPRLPMGAGVPRGRTFGEAISDFKAGIASSGRRPPRNDKPMAELRHGVLAIYRSTEAILSHGATSGAAMLFGFCAGVTPPDSCHLSAKPPCGVPDPC